MLSSIVSRFTFCQWAASHQFKFQYFTSLFVFRESKNYCPWRKQIWTYWKGHVRLSMSWCSSTTLNSNLFDHSANWYNIGQHSQSFTWCHGFPCGYKMCHQFSLVLSYMGSPKGPQILCSSRIVGLCYQSSIHMSTHRSMDSSDSPHIDNRLSISISVERKGSISKVSLSTLN